MIGPDAAFSAFLVLAVKDHVEHRQEKRFCLAGPGSRSQHDRGTCGFAALNLPTNRLLLV